MGFCDVMLTGLARDGGLYVPEAWPQLSPETIAGFFGRPYWEVAVDVIRAVCRRRNFRRRSRPHGQRGLRHVPPSGGGSARPDRPQSIRAGAVSRSDLAFKDVAMQLISRLMDHVLAKRGAAHHHRGRDLGRYRRRRGRCVRGSRQCRSGRAVSAWPDLRGAAADDDDDGRRQRSRARDRRHFDDCQAIVKGLFNHHSFRDAVSLSGVNSINWARIVAQVVYYFTSAVALGAPRAHGGFHRADREFRRHLRRLRRQADGLAGALAAHRRQRQRYPAAHAEDRHLRGARGSRHGVAVDGHPGLVEFRAAVVRGEPAAMRRRFAG